MYALDDDGCHVALVNFGCHGLDVVQRHKGDVAVDVDWCLYLGIVGGLNGQRGAAVKSLVKGHHALLACVERRQLHGILVGLGARVDEKQLVVVVAACSAQPCGELALQRVDHRVGVEHQLLCLPGERLDIVGVAVAHRYHGMAAVEVEILGALAVVHVAAAPFHNLYIKEWIYVI